LPNKRLVDIHTNNRHYARPRRLAYSKTSNTFKMKKLIILLLLFSFTNSFSQALPNFDEIKLDQGVDYKAAEPSAVQAASYILSTPFEKNDLNRLKSLQFIIKWMSGTPDYSFTLDDVVNKIKGNDDLLGIYMACMTKYCLENKESAKDQKLVKLNSIKLLLAYCENENNKMKMTKQLKKLSEANKKGELEKEL
jgi:hypothetical protein